MRSNTRGDPHVRGQRSRHRPDGPRGGGGSGHGTDKGHHAVHLAGRPLDLDRVNPLRDERGLFVVEDAAHAIGAQWKGRPIGSLGNLTAFSFYVTRTSPRSRAARSPLDDEAFATRIEQAALHGLSLGAWQRFSDEGFKHYEATDLGFKFNMTDVQAALRIHQLPHLDEFIQHRRRLWERYNTALADLPLSLPAPASQSMRHARHLYQMRVGEEAPLDRDRLLDSLHRRRIGAGVHYRGVHLHPYYRDRYRLDSASLPVATDISESTLSLPLGPTVTGRDQDDVAEALEVAFASGSPSRLISRMAGHRRGLCRGGAHGSHLSELRCSCAQTFSSTNRRGGRAQAG